MFCFWGPLVDPVGSLGIFLGPLRYLLEAFWDSVAFLWELLGTLGVYRVCPKGGEAPLGRPDWGSLVILWGFLETLWEPFVGTLRGQTDRHTDKTRPDQRPDQTRGQTRDQTDRQIRDQSRPDQPSLEQSNSNVLSVSLQVYGSSVHGSMDLPILGSMQRLARIHGT